MAANNTQGASTSDVLTALKNLVAAINNASTTFLNVHGTTNSGPISTPTVIKSSAGRIRDIGILQVGSATGTAYDGSLVASLSKPQFIIPNYLGVYEADWPFSIGILIVPGSGQILTVTYS